MELETPMSHQSPRVDRGRGLLGPAALRTCPLASPRSQVRARLGPGATVGVLGTGVPRLASLWPTAWLHQWPRTAHLHQQTLKTLARAQTSRGGRCKTSSGAASPGWLVRGGETKARDTSQGSCDASHDDWRQAGASARSVLVSSLVLKRQAHGRSPEASGKGFHIGATRPRLLPLEHRVGFPLKRKG